MDRVRDPVAILDHDYVATNVTTAAWVELIDEWPEASTAIEFFDTSGRVIKIATGAPGSEVEVPYQIFPGGSGVVPIQISKGQRVAIRAVDATASVGRLFVNIFGGK